MNWLEVVAYAYNPSIQEAETGGSLQVQGQPGYIVSSSLVRAT